MAVKDCLIRLGFLENSIVRGDSGNGGHVLIRVDLPNDDQSRDLVRACLEALAAQFDGDAVQVDRTVFNAARIWKLPGTLACKGDSTAARPHRPARLVEVPPTLEIAPIEALQALAATAPTKKEPTHTPTRTPYDPFELLPWLATHGIEVKTSQPYRGGTRHILRECPFDPDHSGTSVAVFERADGRLGFKCQHNSCVDKKWADLRNLKEPERSQGGAHSRPVEKAPDYKPAELKQILQRAEHWFHLPDTGPLEAALGAQAANCLPGDPTWLLLVATPGGGKTETLNTLQKIPDVHPVSVLTEASLLSGTPRREAAGAKGGLLRELGAFGTLLVKDFGSMLSLNKNDRGPILAALREIYDGAWTRYVGSDGGRKLSWAGKCGLIGGATPAIDGHYAVMAALGERFTYYRLPDTDDSERAGKALEHAGHETEMREEMATLVAGLFTHLDFAATPTALCRNEQDKLINLAMFATRCRSSVERESYSTREIQLIPGAESPTRLVKVLAQLLRGLEVIGVTRARGWEIVEKIALDSMPALRQRVVLSMMESDMEETKTAELATRLGYPTQTTRRTLEDLACYGIVKRTSQGTGNADLWQLTDWSRNVYGAATVTVPEIREDVYTPSTANKTSNIETRISGTVLQANEGTSDEDLEF